VLPEKALLLQLYDGGFASVVLLLDASLLELHLPLSTIDSELLLPEALDLTFVLKFAHSALLCIHLLEALVLSKLLHQLQLELIFHAALLSEAFLLKTLLVSLGI
jgi:hypothetical protein